MKNTKIKAISLIICLLMVVGVVVGGTIAYLQAKSNEVTNTFTPSTVTTEILEEFNGTKKENVRIQNTGDTDAFIRAAIVVTWQDKDGNVYGQKPTEDDYVMTLTEYAENDTEKWIEGSDGFYYWNKVVAKGGETGKLIDSVTYTANAPDGYALCVEILGSGVQAGPKAAVEAWSKGVAELSDDWKTITVQEVE